MEFNVNSPVLFLIAGIIVAAVLAQSVYFLVKAWRRGLAIGMGKDKLKRVAITAGVFTVAPAVAIVISVITLAKDLGVPLPWLRLSVVGSLSYETTQYVTIACVMTVSIMVGIWLVPLIGKKLQNGVISMENRDKKWGEIFSASMFIGMISAFLGYVFCDFSSVFRGDMSGLIPVLVFVVSALVMCLAGLLVKKTQWRWVSDYALPISLVAGMASAIPITAWLS